MALVLGKRLILCCYTLSIISVANATTVNGIFQVLMTIQRTCTVTAGSAPDITLGPVNATATNTSTNNTISINCSKAAPYFIDLTPPAANGGAMTGSSTMSSIANAATNTGKVPYQLNRISVTDSVWGNTTANTAPGNGIAATGTDLTRAYTVYATAPNANFTPDNCADTVAVNVNY